MQQRSGSRFSTRSLARMSATHAKTTVAVWVLVLVAALGLNNAWGADAVDQRLLLYRQPGVAGRARPRRKCLLRIVPRSDRRAVGAIHR
jgi:hypothetical protein